MKYFLALTLILASCTDKNKDGPYKVKIPIEDSNGGYSLQVVEIPTLQNPNSVESNLIKVRLNTKVSNGKIISEKAPNAKYILADNNVIIPKDVISGQLFGLYKIMEDLYNLDKASGISTHLSYPRTVSLQVDELSQLNQNESVYLKRNDRILVSTATDGNLIPVAFSKSLIAHEHFRAIFNVVTQAEQKILGTSKAIKSLFRVRNDTIRLDVKKLNENQKWNYMFFDMLEESLADYWSHLASGKENLFPEQLVKTQVRIMDGSVGTLPPLDILEASMNFDKFFSSNLDSQKEVAENIYLTSVQFSNLIKKLSQTLGHVTNAEKATWIVSGLKNLENLLSNSRENKITPTQFIAEFLKFSNKSIPTPQETCDVLKVFLQAYQPIETCI